MTLSSHLVMAPEETTEAACHNNVAPVCHVICRQVFDLGSVVWHRAGLGGTVNIIGCRQNQNAGHQRTSIEASTSRSSFRKLLFPVLMLPSTHTVSFRGGWLGRMRPFSSASPLCRMWSVISWQCRLCLMPMSSCRTAAPRVRPKRTAEHLAAITKPLNIHWGEVCQTDDP